MPILKGAATFSRYRVETKAGSDIDWANDLPRILKLRAFKPLDRKGQDERVTGFCELEDHDRVEFGVGELFRSEYALFCYRVDEFRIPAPVVRTELERWQKEFEREQQRKPSRREKNDAKGEIRHTLKARAPIQTKCFDVSWNMEKAQLQIWAGSRKQVEEVEAALEQAFAIKLHQQVPVVVAGQLGIQEQALVPTPALSLPDARAEVANG